MGRHPDPLNNLGWEDVVDFLLAHGCKHGANQGDDAVFYYEDNRTFGILVSCHPKKKKSGYSKITLLDNIRSLATLSKSRVNKTTWRDWFREKRNF